MPEIDPIIGFLWRLNRLIFVYLIKLWKKNNKKRLFRLWIKIHDIWIEVLFLLTVWPWESRPNDLCVLIYKNICFPHGSKTSHLSNSLGQHQLLNMVFYTIKGWAPCKQPKDKIRSQDPTPLLMLRVIPGLPSQLVPICSQEKSRRVCSWRGLMHIEFCRWCGCKRRLK